MILEKGGPSRLYQLFLASVVLVQQVSLQVEAFIVRAPGDEKVFTPSISDHSVAPQRENASRSSGDTLKHAPRLRSSQRGPKTSYFGSLAGVLAPTAMKIKALRASSSQSEETSMTADIMILCVTVLFGIIVGCCIVCCCCVDREELLRELKAKLDEAGYQTHLANISAKPLDEQQQLLWRRGTTNVTNLSGTKSYNSAGSSSDTPSPRHQREGQTTSSSPVPKKSSSLLRNIGQNCCPDRQLKKKERLPNTEGVESTEQDFAWLNFLLSSMWSRIDVFAAKKINEQVGEALHRALPQFKGMITIKGLSLGSTAPKLGPIRVREHDLKTAHGGIENATVIDCMFVLDTPQTISIAAVGVGLGIDHVRLEGIITIALRKQQDKPPFFGGAQIYFINSPSLDINFTGMTSIPGMKGIIESSVMNLIEKELMLPRCVGVDLDKDDDLDDADITFPEPLGAIGLQLISASQLLAADYNYTSAASSDPFIVIKIGMTEWTSPIIYNSLNPVWPENTMAEFFIFDRKQEISFSAWDYDTLSASDAIGKAEHVAVDPLMEGTRGGKVMKATIPLTQDGQDAGIINVQARWFTLSRQPPTRKAARIVNAGPSQITLEVKLLTISGLPPNARPPFYVRVAAEGIVEKTTKKSRADKLKFVRGDLYKAIVNMHAEGIEQEQISRVLGLHPTEVKSTLEAARDLEQSRVLTWDANKLRQVTHPKIDEVIFLLLPWRDGVERPQVTLELQNKWQSKIGETVLLPLEEAVARAGREIGGPFDFGNGIFVQGSISAKYLSVVDEDGRRLSASKEPSA